MLEAWLETKQSNFHGLVDSTIVKRPLQLNRDEVLKYLKLIQNFEKSYSSICNYDLTDYQRLIYIECTFKEDEEIMSIINLIKQRISNAYIYKHKYFKRITNDIPREYFNNIYDGWLAKHIDLNPAKYQKQREQIDKEG